MQAKELPNRNKERAAFLRQHLESGIDELIIQYLQDMKPLNALDGMATLLTHLTAVVSRVSGLATRDAIAYRAFIETFYKNLQDRESVIEFDGITYFDEFKE